MDEHVGGIVAECVDPVVGFEEKAAEGVAPMFWWAVVLDGVVKVVWKEKRVQASRRRGLASESDCHSYKY